MRGRSSAWEWCASVAVVAALGGGCASTTPTTQSLARDAAAAMGGEDALKAVQSVVMRGGTGQRYRLGSTVRATDAEPAAALTNVVETLDLANGRAVLDYEIRNGDFAQHRQEILTRKDGKPVGLEQVGTRPLAVMSPAALFSWGTQNSPEFLLIRNPVSAVLAALTSPAPNALESRVLNGETYQYGRARLPSGETIGLYFDTTTKLLAAFDAVDTESMIGDVPAVYRLSEYREVGGLRLPHAIEIHKGGQPYSNVTFASAAVNDTDALTVFTVPESVAEEADRAIAEGVYSPITLVKAANGVWFAQGYSHHSMVVEFPTFLAVVEAPYTEAQSHTLARVLRAQFPTKPMRYVAVTHFHYDHTGGVRGLASYGATILVEKGHEAVMRPLMESPHTNPPDALQRARQGGTAGQLEIFEGRRTITDGPQSLELLAIAGNPHVDPKVLAYVPSTQVLFQSDLFFPGTGAPASPAAVHLFEQVKVLKLKVSINIGGHGGVAPFAELEEAAAAAARTTATR
jgi:glyoxylase-like metal-dependent hydrolase (beta-lactamase superfamily II)